MRGEAEASTTRHASTNSPPHPTDMIQGLRLLAETTGELVCLSDPRGRITWISEVADLQLDHAPEALVGLPLERIVLEADRPAHAALMAQLHANGMASANLRLRTAAGGSRWMECKARLVDPQDPEAGVMSRWRDLTAEMELRRQLDNARRTDPLSGLASRTELIARLEERINQPHGRAGIPALLSIGVDRLSQVNDALTHRAGDALITTLAARLAGAVDADALAARGTGDTFLVLLDAVAGDNREAGAASLTRAEHLRAACQGPIAVEGQVLEPTVSIGVAIAEPGLRADELLRDASLAMRQASAQGRDRCALAGRRVSEEPRRALALQAGIRSALATDSLTAWFMPVVDLATGELHGYEALVRWLHPDGTVGMPDDFLPIARRSPLAVEIDLHVLRQSITALGTLPAPLFVAVNLTPATLSHPDLDARVCEWLKEAGVSPQRLQLEITETDLLNLAPQVRLPIDRLAAIGVRWLIDDFGTGYSSISHLRDLPIHGIKLDRSFTAAIGAGDLKSVRLAQALAGMAEGLGLTTVAEGVERAAEATCLLEFGWQAGQGWHYGQAVPLAEVSGQSRTAAATTLDPTGTPLATVADRSMGAVTGGPVLTRHRWAVAVTDSVPVGLFALRVTPEGGIQFLFVSRRWLEMLHLSREAVLADASLAFACIHPEDGEDFDRCWRTRVAALEPLFWEGRLRDGTGPRWVRIESVPQLQSDGSSVWQGVMSDITDSKQRELDLQRSLDHAPVAIVALSLNDPDPEITYVNRAFQRTFGYERSAIPRRSDWARLSFPDPGYREATLAEWHAELAEVNGGEAQLSIREVRVCTADGRFLDVLTSAVVLDGVLLVSLLDITDRRRAERQLLQARTALAETALSVTEAIPVGTYTMVLPPDGGMASFSFMSERFLEIAGLEREAAEADPLNAFACVHPDDYDAWVQRNAEVFAARLPFHGETRIVVDGEVRWISAESVPRELPDGSTVWEGVLIDITDRIRVQQELQEEKARLATTLDSLLDPHITLQPLRNGAGQVVDFVILDANGAACADLGLTCEQLVGARFQERLPAHHAAGLLARYGAVIETGEPLALNDFCLGDGHRDDHPILDIRVVRVEGGLSCTWRDGRERYEAARLLAESEERYRLLAENSSDVVMQLGNDGTIRWVSPSLTAMLGWEPSEWIGRPGTEFLEHRGDTETYQANLAALQAGRSVVARDRVRSRNGTWHWVETHACGFRTASGAIDGLVAFFRTIDAEVEAEAALARQASTDALTGLPNRRETFRRLEALTAAQGTMGEAARPGLALAFCDIDHFKRVNDSLGHAAGDALLLAIGQRLRAVLRPDDLVGRIGGDELLVVLVGVADLQTAMERAEALRAAVREPLPITNNHLDVTASIGVTLFQPGESVDALVARADAAMYEAKQAGRDRVIPIQP